MSNTDQLQRIAGYWMKKARESLKSAKVEFELGHLDFCVNRLYYTVFYSVSAVLAKQGLTYGKHAAVRASFHRDFVKKGIVSKEFGKLYDRLFNARQEADYIAFTDFDAEVVKNQLVQVEEFVAKFSTIMHIMQKNNQ
jgi:uncharacterized protein (UPF0332 family)